MVVSESTLGVLSKKHNFDDGGGGGGGTQSGMWKLMTKTKENWFYCGFGQWFLVWKTKWYSEIIIFWKISTEAITITTRACPQSFI